MEELAVAHLVNLGEQLQAAGRHEAAEHIRKAAHFHSLRFWHEMSTALLAAIKDPYVLERAYELHEHVLLSVRADISPIAYVKLLYFTCFGSTGSSAAGLSQQEALQMIDGACASLIASSSPQGNRAAQCIRALLLLDSASVIASGDREQNANEAAAGRGDGVNAVSYSTVRRILNGVEEFLEQQQMHEVEPLLLLLHSKARGKDYHLRKLNTKYYYNAFEIVENANRAQMPLLEGDLTRLATGAAFAALQSDEIYNFGKLLNYKPFTSRLSPWLGEWLQLANKGDVNGFEAFARSHESDISRELVGLYQGQSTDVDALKKKLLSSLMHKVRLMALLHLVFHTPLSERSFPFAVIAERCCVAADTHVEPLLLSALARGIAKGTLDGLKNIAHITWVQPRVLSLEEIREFAKNIGEWRVKVAGLSEYVSRIKASEMAK